MKFKVGDTVTFATTSIRTGVRWMQTFTLRACPGIQFLVAGYENFGRETVCWVTESPNGVQGTGV